MVTGTLSDRPVSSASQTHSPSSQMSVSYCLSSELLRSLSRHLAWPALTTPSVCSLANLCAWCSAGPSDQLSPTSQHSPWASLPHAHSPQPPPPQVTQCTGDMSSHGFSGRFSDLDGFLSCSLSHTHIRLPPLFLSVIWKAGWGQTPGWGSSHPCTVLLGCGTCRVSTSVFCFVSYFTAISCVWSLCL